MPFTRIDTGLYRFDNEEKSEHGYVVNLSRQGVQHVCRFADGVHGGKRAALDAARAWRDEIIAKHPHHSRHDYVQILRRNNTSGTPGVSARKDADGDITHWVAHWLMPGSDHKLSRKFALSEHGPARAKQLAIRAREAGVSGLVDDPWVRRESDRDPALAAHRRKLAEAARAARANDWRLARVQVSRLAVSLHFICGAALKIPFALVPALRAVNQRTRSAWEMHEHEVVWPALKLTIYTRTWLAPGLLKPAAKRNIP